MEYKTNTEKAMETYKSDADKVKEFTEESMGIKCPTVPTIMSKKEVEFITKMILSELTELAQTISDTPEDALNFVKNCIGTDFNKNYKKPEDDIKLCAEQYDAFVDIWYYSLNMSCKKGVNLSKIFDVVHQANMNKRWSDGKFHRREDGKVLKPDNFEEAKIDEEIKRQMHIL